MGKKLFILTAIMFIGGMLLNIGYYFLFPDVAALAKKNPAKTAFMEYREREWQREGKNKKIKQRWVSLSRISPYVIKAVIIAEDDKFWGHEGFDFEAMQKALEKDIQQGKFKPEEAPSASSLPRTCTFPPPRIPSGS